MSNKMQFTVKLYLIDALYFIFLLLEFRFFFIVPLPVSLEKINTYHNKMLEVALIFVIIVVCKRYHKQELKNAKLVFMYLGIITLDFIYTVYRYPRGDFKEIFVPYCAYWILLLYFPLSEYLRIPERFNRFVRIYRGMNIIACTIVILQALVYNYKQIYFLNIYEFSASGNLMTRNGIRIPYLSTVISIALVLSIAEMMVLKKQILQNLINALLSIIYFVYISQTRVYILMFAILILYAFYFMGDINRNRLLLILLTTITIIIGVWALDIPKYITDLILPILDGSYIYNGSYYARLEAYKYFGSTILANPVMGLGLMRPGESSPYYYVIRGFRGVANYTDIGLFGTLAEFGWPVVLLFIYMMKKTYIGRNSELYDHYAPYKRLFWMFMLLSCGTLSVFDPQRVFVLTMALAIFDCQEKSTGFINKINI